MIRHAPGFRHDDVRRAVAGEVGGLEIESVPGPGQARRDRRSRRTGRWHRPAPATRRFRGHPAEPGTLSATMRSGCPSGGPRAVEPSGRVNLAADVSDDYGKGSCASNVVNGLLERPVAVAEQRSKPSKDSPPEDLVAFPRCPGSRLRSDPLMPGPLVVVLPRRLAAWNVPSPLPSKRYVAKPTIHEIELAVVVEIAELDHAARPSRIIGNIEGESAAGKCRRPGRAGPNPAGLALRSSPRPPGP